MDNSLDINLNIIESDEAKDPKYVNAFRVGISEDSFVLDFGFSTIADERNRKIEVISKLAFPADKLMTLFEALFQAGMEYEEKYKKQVFPKFDK